MVQGDFQRFVNVRVSRNNRPLWVGATHGEATKPSEASAERRVSPRRSLSAKRSRGEYAEAVRGGFALRTDFIVTHKQGFISGDQPPDPRCGVPCRAAAIKLSAYSAPQRLCVKTYNSTYSIDRNR